MNFHSTDPDGLPAWRRESRLFKALAASALLHLVLLWPAAYPRPKLQLAQPLAARLRPAAEIAAPAPPAQPAATAGVPEAASRATKSSTAPPRSRSVRDERKPVLVAAEPQAAALDPGRQETAREPVAQPPAAGDLAAATGTAIPGRVGDSGSAQVSAAAEQPVAGVDPQALVEYRFALNRFAARHYPLLARVRGLSGRVDVRVTVAEDGRPRDVSVTRSAGHRLLDEEARSTIALAAARAVPPASLRGRVFTVDLPVIFDLQDGD